MVNLGFEAFEKTCVNGVTYRTVKKFKDKKKAEEYKESVCMKSKRYPPIVEQVKIGMGLGYLYYVKEAVL